MEKADPDSEDGGGSGLEGGSPEGAEPSGLQSGPESPSGFAAT